MPKIEFGDNFFKIDGLPYQKGNFDPTYNASSELFGIVRKDNPNIQLVTPLLFSEWTDSGDNAYSSFQALLDDLEANFFF